jgi:hypothetical protein
MHEHEDKDWGYKHISGNSWPSKRPEDGKLGREIKVF